MSEKRKQSQDDQFEIDFYEKLLEKRPDFADALAALGDLYTKCGYFEKGLEMDLRLAQMRPDDPVVLYNLACSYSLLNDLDKALRSVKKAINRGYNDYSHLEKDIDLNNLRKDSRFLKYWKLIKAKKISKAEEIES